MSTVINRLRHSAGLDRAVSTTVLMRVVSAMMGLATLGLIYARLNPVQQGFYFTFATILQLQVDFGLSYVVMQVASHEMAWLHIGPEGTIEGEVRAKRRLASLLRTTLLWYGGVAAVLVAGIGPAGQWYLASGKDAGAADWVGPWWTLCFATAAYIVLNALFSLMEGVGLVAEIAMARLIQTIAGSLVLWGVLFSSNGLYAAAANFGLFFLSGAAWLLWTRGALLADLFRTEPGPDGVAWRTEVWPFQWKVGVSWLALFFGFWAIVPILYRTSGAVDAGRMGMELQILAAISGVAIAWVYTKAPTFGKLVASASYRELDDLFAVSLRRSLAVVGLGGLLFCLTVSIVDAYGLSVYGRPIGPRLLPPVPTILLTLSVIGGVVFSAESIYLRAHRQEPFLSLSVVVAICVVLFSILLAPTFGSLGVTAAYLAIVVGLYVIVGTRIFLTKRSEWHLQ